MEVGLLIVLKSNADGDSSISLKYFQKEKNNKVMDVLKVSFLFFFFLVQIMRINQDLLLNRLRKQFI